jgi:lipopolysaccharide transport system ATP-binding protein
VTAESINEQQINYKLSMSDIVIKVEDVGKLYRLGEVGTGTLSQDLKRWWAVTRGNEDPFARIGETNDRTQKGNSEYVWALKNINFEVKQGEVLGIIGRNGAGKSTLLKLLSKVTTPSTGNIKVKGRIASLLEVGTGFHPDLTGRENVFLNGAILGMTKAEVKSKFDEIVDFAGVERYIDTPVKRYSSGMYVRLAFAVAAFLEPEILIVDEVLAVGDSEFQKKCLGRMKDVSVNDGRTVLFVSHNMAAIENLCQNAIVMQNGGIFLKGEASAAILSYLSLNESKAKATTLGERKERQGDGKLKFTDVKLFDAPSKKEIFFATTGQDVILRLYIEAKNTRPIDKLLVAVGINDMLDNRISHISNELTNQFTTDLPLDLHYVDVRINRLPLNAGNYNLALYAAINNEVSDWVQNAYFFTIEAGDFYKTGKTIPSAAGNFLIDYQYSLG